MIRLNSCVPIVISFPRTCARIFTVLSLRQLQFRIYSLLGGAITSDDEHLSIHVVYID